jgi:UDP-GlcNAc:undecaprenyl-phosphate GlcNAc-1-phosphate transferase
LIRVLNNNIESLVSILAFVFSFVITFLSIPSIIEVAELKHLFDEPDHRKKHKRVVPTIGGLAIFAGLIISTLLFADLKAFSELQFVLAAILILFFLGIKDDIVVLTPYAKFVGQFFSAIIICWLGDIRIHSLQGIFNIYELPYELSIIFSVLTALVIINSFNLIDGIDCLAGTIGFIVTAAFAAWFYKAGYYQPLILSLSLMGALLAFLRYNITPAKIFMGDTGSLLIGTVVSVLAIKFISLNGTAPSHSQLVSAPVIAFGIMIIPLYDLLRVFTIRILKKKSPFNPDRSHIHHKLIDLGLSHMQSTLVLAIVNILFIVVIFIFQKLSLTFLLLLIFVLASLLTILLSYLVRVKNKRVLINK